MRKPIIAGNWKMYKTVADSVAFAQALVPHMANYPQVDRVVAPSFVALHAVAEALKGTGIQVSSQQMHYEVEGAFTSQISPTMLQGIAEYAIIGHSECRQYLNETDETVNKKTKAALKYNITPIVAIGESIETRRAGEADSFVSNQLRAALVGLTADEVAKIVIAYEPIWAIGTGESATPQIASDMCGGVVRGTLRQLYGDVADVVRIQYGGSVKPDNMHDYMSQPDIDGALVGGASLKVESFTELIKLAVQAKGL
jgi:triosephosphate isomerase (TIM)